MRIAQVVPSLEEQHGGPSRSVHALAAALARLGDEVDLLATRPGADMPPAREGRLRVLQFRRDSPEFLCPSTGLRAHLRREAYDCVHHHGLWLRTLHYAHRARRSAGPGFVISPRGMLSDWAWGHHRWKKWLAARLVHRGAMAAAGGWHATSEAESDDIRRRGFTRPVCVAPNGVNAPTADELTHAHETWHQLCPAVSQRPVALFYSRFHRKKRLLELLNLWLEAAPASWLLLVAGVPEEYSPADLEARLRERGAGDRVFVVDGRGRPPPYAVASLFLLPSHSENFGLVIAEAMAWGVPVLVTDSTPWAEVSRHRAGWCVPWTDYPGALQTALGESIDQLEQRGARARDWVLSRYSWDEVARPLHVFYRRLCPEVR